MLRNRGRTSLPFHLNPRLSICSIKVRFLIHCRLFISPRNFPNTLYSPKRLSGTLLHNFAQKWKMKKSKDEEKGKMKRNFSTCYLKRQLPKTYSGWSFSGLLTDGEEKAPVPKICQAFPTIMKLGTLIPYLKKIRKKYKSHDTPLEFWCHPDFLPEIRNFCYIKKYR